MTDNPTRTGRRVIAAAWWLTLVRAVLLVLFGIVTLAAPGITLLALVLVFGVYAVGDGVAAVVMGVRLRATDPTWGWIVAQGVVSVLAGVVALVWPGLSALGLLYVIAFWAIMLGASAISHAVRGRHVDDRWGWALAKGALDVLFGVVLIASPAAGILALLWLVGVFTVAGGVVLAVLAFRIRALVRTG